MCSPAVDTPKQLCRPVTAISFVGVLVMCLQSLGAADADDKDGQMVANLVNKAALDTIAMVGRSLCALCR